MNKKITQIQIMFDDGTIDTQTPDSLDTFILNGIARTLRGGVTKVAMVILTEYGEVKTFWTDDRIRQIAIEYLKKLPWEEDGE